VPFFLLDELAVRLRHPETRRPRSNLVRGPSILKIEVVTPGEQKELLLRVVTKLAVTRLERGGFIPFGATLASDRNVKLLLPETWKKNAKRDEVESYWSRELRQSCQEQGCSTACSCADVRVPAPDGAFTPGLLIHFEHAGLLAEDILYPYEKSDRNQVSLGPPTSVSTEPQIFASPRNAD